MRQRHSLRLGLLLGLGLILCTAIASADSGPQAADKALATASAQSARASLPAWGGNMPAVPWGRLVCGTIAVVALICVGVYVLKRLNGGAPLSRGRYLELLESRPLGRNVQLFLVRVAGKVVLLASGGGSVTQVAELGEDELPELSAVSPPDGLETFRNLFRKLAGARS